MWNDEFDFNKEWLTTADYELKILMLIVVLAENNLAYRGTLTTMCDWLNLYQHTYTYKRISNAIDSLEKKQYIHHIQEGRTHTLSISNKGLRDKRSIKIRKAWVDTIHNYKDILPETTILVDWAKLIKVFIYCCCDIGDVRSNTNRAQDMGISKDTFRRCLNILKLLNFDGLQIDSKVIRSHNVESNYWITLGTEISVGRVFEGSSDNKAQDNKTSVAIPYWPDPDEYDYESTFDIY